MPRIDPTVGRVLYFQPSAGSSVKQYDTQPIRADIIYVHSPDCVKLHAIDHDGAHHVLSSVPLVQADEIAPGSYYAYWMPFQVGQARVAQPEADRAAPPDHPHPQTSASAG